MDTYILLGIQVVVAAGFGLFYLRQDARLRDAERRLDALQRRTATPEDDDAEVWRRAGDRRAALTAGRPTPAPARAQADAAPRPARAVDAEPRPATAQPAAEDGVRLDLSPSLVERARRERPELPHAAEAAGPAAPQPPFSSESATAFLEQLALARARVGMEPEAPQPVDEPAPRARAARPRPDSPVAGRAYAAATDAESDPAAAQPAPARAREAAPRARRGPSPAEADFTPLAATAPRAAAPAAAEDAPLDRVLRLARAGRDTVDIARATGRGRGEIELLMKLYQMERRPTDRGAAPVGGTR